MIRWGFLVNKKRGFITQKYYKLVKCICRSHASPRTRSTHLTPLTNSYFTHLSKTMMHLFGVNTKLQDAKVRFSLGGLPLFPQTWIFRNFSILCFLDYTKVKKSSKKYAHHYNQCKIWQGIQIRAQNWVTMQKKAGKRRKPSENHKIACKKNDVEKYLVQQ